MPPKARSARAKARNLRDIPLEVMSHELLGTRVITLMDYRKKEVQDLIHSLKYDASKHSAKMAAMLLADYLREEISSARLYSQKPILLIPIPLHKTRYAERGYNQIEIVLRALPSEFKDGTLSTLAPKALARIRATAHQTKLRRAERIQNTVGAFSCPNPTLIENSHIFLIDDVTTTGATLKSASESMKKTSAQVTLLALARA